MNEFDKSFKKDVSAVNKRRNFLKKSATGAVIASLPAKSVWGGCSVSGSLSGNLSTHGDKHECTLPYLNNGRSPGNWLNYDENLQSTFTVLALAKSTYGPQSDEYKDTKKLLLEAIEEVFEHDLDLPTEFNAIPYTVGEGLSSNGTGNNNIYFHLAAVYLNTYFGFYTTYGSGQLEALQAITDVFSYWFINKDTGVTISDSDLGYTDGSTDWAPSS